MSLDRLLAQLIIPHPDHAAVKRSEGYPYSDIQHKHFSFYFSEYILSEKSEMKKKYMCAMLTFD